MVILWAYYCLSISSLLIIKCWHLLFIVIGLHVVNVVNMGSLNYCDRLMLLVLWSWCRSVWRLTTILLGLILYFITLGFSLLIVNWGWSESFLLFWRYIAPIKEILLVVYCTFVEILHSICLWRLIYEFLVG